MKRLVRLLLLWAAASSLATHAADPARNLAISKGETRVALVIGNSDYRSGPLLNPVNDARAMAAKLRALGFTVRLKENLKAREIGGVYREFRNLIAPGSVALVFYAGHGVQFKGQNYFPAVDSEISAEEDVPLQSLNLGTLLDNMEEAKAGVSLVLLDACRDNPFARRFRSASRGLAKVEAASGTLIHYATRPGSVASDGDGKNGTYTEALLTEMDAPGVPIELMLKQVSNRVVAKTQGKQEPWVEGSLRGNFSFRSGVGTQVAQLGAGIGGNARTPEQIEDELWDAIKTSTKPSVFEAYVREYPKGRYAAQARIKLADLAESTQAIKQTSPPAASAAGSSKDAQAVIETRFGSITLRLFPDVAPKHVANFLDLARKGFYDGTTFHRVIPNFMIQGGDPNSRNADRATHGQGGPGYKINAEFNGRPHKRGTLAMARAAAPDSAGSQFYICVADAPFLDGKHTVFGEVVSGMEVVDQIVRAPRDSRDNPLERIEMNVRVSIPPESGRINAVGKTFKDCDECPEMVVIPAGSFAMGGNFYNEKPVHTVRIGKPFAMAKTELTLRQWHSIMGSYPKWMSTRVCDECPVSHVSWENAQQFAMKLSQKTGKSYRLPSEAEWEYACRAGNNDTYCGSNDIDTVAWYVKNSGGKSHPVAAKQPNKWGLYDMSGNISEWTLDCKSADYVGAPDDGSAWTSGDCTNRMVRGGAWSLISDNARAAIRDGLFSGDALQDFVGFRLVRPLQSVE